MHPTPVPLCAAYANVQVRIFLLRLMAVLACERWSNPELHVKIHILRLKITKISQNNYKSS